MMDWTTPENDTSKTGTIFQHRGTGVNKVKSGYPVRSSDLVVDLPMTRL